MAPAEICFHWFGFCWLAWPSLDALGMLKKRRRQLGEKLDKDFRVVAVSYPLQYLTSRIAGGLVAVDCPVPLEVVDPSQWKPSREAILADAVGRFGDR